MVLPKRAAGILPAEGGDIEFGSRSEWARSNCRQDAGSTLSETTMKRCARPEFNMQLDSAARAFIGYGPSIQRVSITNMPRLLVNPGSPQQWEIPLKQGTVTLGRSPACDAQIEHDSISGTHCQIVVSGDTVTVKDLGSTNGSFLNGSAINDATLAPGQRLQLGSVELELIADPPRTAAPSAIRISVGSAAASASAATVIATSSAGPPRVGIRMAAHEAPPPPPSIPASYVPDEYSEAPEAPAACKYHPKSAARYLCPQCQLYYCELCVTTRSGGERTGRFCLKCSGECVAMNVQLIVPVDHHANFFIALPAAFLFPFKGGGLIFLICGALFFGFLDFLDRYGGLFAIGLKVVYGGYLFSFMQKIIQTAAQGSEEPASWPDVTEFWQDIVQPFLQLLVTGLVCFAPAVFLAVWLRVNPLAYLSPAGTLDPVKGIAVLATLLAGAAYFPMAVLAVAMFDRVFALSPTVIIPAIVRVPLEYLTVLVIMAVILGIKVAGQYAATLLVIPFLPTFLASSLGIYFLIVQMRLLGLMYYAKRDKLGWFSR